MNKEEKSFQSPSNVDATQPSNPSTMSSRLGRVELYNKYSQHGEDALIEKILSILPSRDKWCVEFGAWDGVYLSNTCNLVKHHGYSAVLVEANPEKYAELTENLSGFPIFPFCTFVNFDGEDSLENILGRTRIPKDFDFISIDIDGADYWVFDSLKEYRPKLVCIEYNPTIPNHVEFVQPRDMRVSQGSSPRSIVKLAREKGYALLATTSCNLFLIDSKYFELFQLADNDLDTLRKTGVFTTMFFGYDGTVFLDGNKSIYWHQIPIPEEKIQLLPKFLRKFPDNYTKWEKFLVDKFIKKQR